MSATIISVLLLACFVATGLCLGNSTGVQPKPTSFKCPPPTQWNGTNSSSCPQRQCVIARGCRRTHGPQAVCCPTSCKGKNCFSGNVHRIMKREKGGAPKCPNNWNGQKCNEDMCKPNKPCQKNGTCCKTKCGKYNCYN